MFSQWAIQIIKDQIILLALDNPQRAIPLEYLDVFEPFKCHAQRLSKEALLQRKKISRTMILSFGKKLPHDVGTISPPLLSNLTIVKSMFH